MDIFRKYNPFLINLNSFRREWEKYKNRKQIAPSPLINGKEFSRTGRDWTSQEIRAMDENYQAQIKIANQFLQKKEVELDKE